ncbi:hypothetical protein FA95DRAFT_1484733 [Auriscalpium vulgare]|uniref:Uncharacterized protein n=1 Tax=Auriscalpium vulgare TaxID=40419 RepID=A0ACB8S6A1_9AGAM|nr:hypothetical protein FA95DRAFT_1484733 [Auriscalpium vulgare]
MPSMLPPSLAPHTCILPSQDLVDLLASSSLPPLPQILQSFSPLPQVTTRTTTLTPVPHPTFALRFSDLVEIEEGCREDEEQRAARTLDWISARISRRCAKWVEDWERVGGAAVETERNANLRTPWWDEVRHCIEGDHIPSRIEGWNHPVAVIVAVSTMSPNPLQALAQLHARPPEFPSWVDGNQLRYTLIIHPKNSALSDEEAGALFNAVKKQYGLHTFLLPLELPSPPPPPVPVPLQPPRLPRNPQSTTQTPEIAPLSPGAIPTLPGGLNTLRMGEQDIQQTARFVREFVAMSLVPWMEKCAVEWNENFSSTRRLPSRLFSSTRRLFGSATPSPTPTHGQNSSISSVTSRTRSGSNSSIASVGSGPPPPPQQRRLAEFATTLGDLKLAINVWETIRKDGKGGSEILPLLLSPSPAVQLHVSHALQVVMTSNTHSSAVAQVRALAYAVRWEMGCHPPDFIGNAEEPPSAVLLAHAAYLSVRKKARRRAALWYLFAANRLEKSGIKPLTMYFLRRAHDLYKVSPEKSLSPSFWDSEGMDVGSQAGFDAIVPGIEHALGRLHYTTGDVRRAVRFFLTLLQGASSPEQAVLSLGTSNGSNLELSKATMSDKVFLEDFRVSFQHLKDTSGPNFDLSDLKLPVTFCDVRHTRLRLPGDSVGGDPDLWESREDTWRTYWKSQGKESLQSTGKAAVNEPFWVDLVMHNPLDVDISLANLTIIIKESTAESSGPSVDFVEVEVIDELVLGAKETQTIPLSVRAKRPSTLFITQASYSFLNLLPSSESLAVRGRRLQDTPIQRQSKVYAPDVYIKALVEDASQRLSVDFVDDGRLVLEHGECMHMRLWVSNIGTEAINDIWIVAGPDDEYCIDDGDVADSVPPPAFEVFTSSNSLAQRLPQRVPLDKLLGSPLAPGQSFEFALTLHANTVGDQELSMAVVFRQKERPTFHSIRVMRSFEVRPLLSVASAYGPSNDLDELFSLDLDIRSVPAAATIEISQVTTMSPTWACASRAKRRIGTLLPGQAVHLPLGAQPWDQRSGGDETYKFALGKLEEVLQGSDTDLSHPPPLVLRCDHAVSTSVLPSTMQSFLHQGRRNNAARHIAAVHRNLPHHLYPAIFPLYHPHAVDVVIFWEIPSEGRSGHILVTGTTLGAGHGDLNGIIQEAEEMKVKRNMYAETQIERSSILEAIRASEWNSETNPVVLTVQGSGAVVEHDFSSSSCHIPVTLSLRNYSLTRPAKYTFKLPPQTPASGVSDMAAPSWIGRLTYRGTLKPLEHLLLRPTLHATQPDTYTLGDWRLEIEVGDEVPSTGVHGWRTQYRYVDGPSTAAPITVVDVSSE